jgi:hypothetical protein
MDLSTTAWLMMVVGLDWIGLDLDRHHPLTRNFGGSMVDFFLKSTSFI